MHPAKRPSLGKSIGVGLATLLIFGMAVSCGTDATKEATVRQLAIGSWACTPDVEESDWQSFTVGIKETGRFTITPDFDASDVPDNAYSELPGAWKITDGDLSWMFDDIPMDQRFRVEGFDALTPESKSFTISDPGPFTSASPPDPDRQKILVDAHGTDSVTLQMPEGEPWTCTRK